MKLGTRIHDNKLKNGIENKSFMIQETIRNICRVTIIAENKEYNYLTQPNEI